MTTGDIEPQGEGAWLTTKEGEQVTGVKAKTLYRQARRGNRAHKPVTGDRPFLVWIKESERRRSLSVSPTFPASVTPDEEPGHSLVPGQGEQFLALLNKATAALGQQVQQLTEEREQARRERDEERERRQAAEAERDALRAAAQAAERRRWWWPW